MFVSLETVLGPWVSEGGTGGALAPPDLEFFSNVLYIRDLKLSLIYILYIYILYI